ncbi:MAG: hypothetical protein JW803_06020 [Endomicrobiales bacterium]|nr:hypothetical protein [Endomicrobiales bacterium]
MKYKFLIFNIPLPSIIIYLVAMITPDSYIYVYIMLLFPLFLGVLNYIVYFKQNTYPLFDFFTHSLIGLWVFPLVGFYLSALEKGGLLRIDTKGLLTALAIYYFISLIIIYLLLYFFIIIKQRYFAKIIAKNINNQAMISFRLSIVIKSSILILMLHFLTNVFLMENGIHIIINTIGFLLFCIFVVYDNFWIRYLSKFVTTYARKIKNRTIL